MINITKLMLAVTLTSTAAFAAGADQKIEDAQPVLTGSKIPVVQIKADQVTTKMPSTFYGLMTEEINYSYEGGLYAELIRNRSFLSLIHI